MISDNRPLFPKKQAKFSIICPSNNNEILKRMLLASLSEQTLQNFELIVVDAKAIGLKSASESLNFGASKAKGEYLIFCHNDIQFLSSDGLEELYSYCSTNNFGIAGVAGKSSIDNEIYSTVKQGENQVVAGKANDIVRPVDSLDECLMVIPRASFAGFEDLGTTWHFYGPSYSCAAKKRNLPVLLFPVWIYHRSPGWSLNPNYYDTLRRFGKKHKDIKTIYTTMGTFKNNWKLPIYCYLKKILLGLKRKRRK